MTKPRIVAEPEEDFRSAFVRARKELGWTQEQAAREIGVSYNAVVKWERGAWMPNLESYRLICKAFGWPAPYPYRDTRPAKQPRSARRAGVGYWTLPAVDLLERGRSRPRLSRNGSVPAQPVPLAS